MTLNILEIAYLIASLTFVIGLKMLSHPESARKGNLIAALGMLIAVIATITIYQPFDESKVLNYGLIALGLVLGTIIGTMMAKKVKMTAMPQMVSFFNGMGGACAALIAVIEYQNHNTSAISGFDGEFLVMLLGLIIGSVSFSGSLIAYGKLEGKIKDFVLPMNQVVNMLMLATILGLTIYQMLGNESTPLFYGLLAISLIYGVLFVMPIGGADMPVVISLLNSFTGVAAAFGGFLYSNKAMLTGGILVGSAGTILTILMCKAMNRSLTNVLLGAFGGSTAGGPKGEAGDQTVREISITDTAVLLSYSQQVVIVPGYGLAVAQAQHICHELEKLLEEKGVTVNYAIHPVAGRMPGHMNVLLAEADVPYERLQEMEEINPKLASTDVVVVIGANDVVNPAAKNDSSSPIYGMPILEVDQAKNVIILKRGMSSGYAGIENELFFYPKTRMLFGDAKDSLQKLTSEVKEV
ncbi:NAD(P)(+) transhydrogenase (Re/Si-specific) subunit beta [Belliella kenyensis]|uniref:NAD(P) transhydrogenase subunit beta n=1 Tax=Belliella kenyensis TaxID=1472724 RepID=A0ABV8EPJ6_9BACT|nr:NAD(P)(+) transhydrogenase (Re/Si-specific) subunit beta [Belliella kenyensis]MCH7402124.1 NAD(P)(+) transhydrogenase (Re/Si-specific) subunit beta [Belliella kenyensis]MDN3601566.1 NAD(P)(+) transhydrogenase (Re/Si-specific) subunit beta [Belliella kenyensis]